VTDSADCQNAVDAMLHSHGRLDAFVANAGVGLFGCFEDLDDAQIRQIFEVNVFGVLNSARAALPALRESRGRLVIVSSVAGRRAAPGSSAYNASKYAIEGWAEALAYEVEPFGVNVVLIEPGPTESGFLTQRDEGVRSGSPPYAAITARLRQLSAGIQAKQVDVSIVSSAIVEALRRAKPPLRIATGASTQAEIIASRLLPTRLFHDLANRKLKLPRS
jgi:NAD(P)-dependent dehydrogenase (short-subunit alcohol dehydrogenase family)